MSSDAFSNSLQDIQNQLDDLKNQLQEQGFLVFKHLGIDSADKFESLVRQFSQELYTKNGEHEPFEGSGSVQTPVFYAPESKLLWHNENTFQLNWPNYIYFSCLTPAETGGETTIVDSHQVYNALPSDIISKFETSGVRYHRRYINQLGLSYQHTFNVAGPAEAEQYCLQNKINYQWKDDVLCTYADRPAVVLDGRQEKQKNFVAQVLHWHPRCLDPDVRRYLEMQYGVDGLPRDVTFANGEAIDDEIIDQLISVYEQIEHPHSWSTGDFVVLNNIRAAHGRNPFTGKRQLLVALSDSRPLGEF